MSRYAGSPSSRPPNRTHPLFTNAVDAARLGVNLTRAQPVIAPDGTRVAARAVGRGR